MDIHIYTLGVETTTWFRNVGQNLLCDARHISAGLIPARPRTQHDCYHDTKVKPEAATAVIELLVMGGKTPETC